MQRQSAQVDIAYVEAMLDHLLGQGEKPCSTPPHSCSPVYGIMQRIACMSQTLEQCLNLLTPFLPDPPQDDLPTGMAQLGHVITQITKDSGRHILNQILDESTDAITIFTPKGEVLFSNQTACSMVTNFHEDLCMFLRLKQKADRTHQKAREDYYCSETGRWLRISLSDIQWFNQQSAYLMMIHDTTEYRQREEKILYQARMDGLTGVYNRTGGLAILREWLTQEDKFPLCICFIDIDYLKQINDCYGHHEGDILITAVAQAIRNCSRSDDLCMRIGGDEFLIVLPCMKYAAAKRTIASIMDSLCNELAGMNKPYHASFSCGIEEVAKMHQLRLDELIQRADQRMYEAKRSRHAQQNKPGMPDPHPNVDA